MTSLSFRQTVPLNKSVVFNQQISWKNYHISFSTCNFRNMFLDRFLVLSIKFAHTLVGTLRYRYLQYLPYLPVRHSRYAENGTYFIVYGIWQAPTYRYRQLFTGTPFTNIHQKSHFVSKFYTFIMCRYRRYSSICIHVQFMDNHGIFFYMCNAHPVGSFQTLSKNYLLFFVCLSHCETSCYR